MVVSPPIPVTVADPFQLSLHSETAFVQSTGSPYCPLVLLAGSLNGWFICIWAWDAISGGHVHVRVIHILLWQLYVWGDPILGTLWASCCYSIFQINGSPSWTGGGTGSFLPSLFKAASSLQHQFGMFLSPQAELCSLLTSTSGELMWVLL